MIEIEHLTRNYGGRPALAGISLAVKPGDLVAIVGPNGSGKTTLFRLLLGLIGPTSGTIRIWGRSPQAQPGELMRRISAVLDNHVPPPTTRIRALLDLKAVAVPTFDRAWCDELLAELPGVTASRRFGELSKGQKQWVLSSLSLAARADLLVLDEPGDGLDTAARRRLFSVLRMLVDERGTTVLVASHVLTDLERVADRLVVLKAGTIRLEGELETLRSEVREIEFAGALPDFCSANGAEVLSAKTISDGTLAWIRRREWHDLPSSWPGERNRRPVGLEDLYLALTNGIGASAGIEAVSHQSAAEPAMNVPTSPSPVAPG